MPQNLTIRIDEGLARDVRVYAARHGTSVSRLVAELLAEKVRSDRAYDAAMSDWLADDQVFEREPGPLPARDELHDRAGLR